VAPNARRIKQVTRFEIHYLRRAKLLTPFGAPVHHGIGVFDTATSSYVEVFHSTDVHGEHVTDFATFAGGLRVERVLKEPIEGVVERLAMARLNPLPWNANHNCQHTATWIYYGVESSHTYESIKDGAVAALLIGTVVALAAG
jgi:hypothetical protein